MDEATKEGRLTAEAAEEERRRALEAVADEEVVAAQEEEDEDEVDEDEDDDDDDLYEDDEDGDEDDDDDDDDEEDDEEDADDAVGTDERGREILRARGANSARVPATDAEPEGSLDEVDTTLLQIQRIEPAVGAARAG